MIQRNKSIRTNTYSTHRFLVPYGTSTLVAPYGCIVI